VLPALQAYVKKNGFDQAPYFYGNNILCKDHTMRERCGGAFMAETQHYTYNIVAQHLLAVCYYASNYGEDAAFSPWVKYTMDDGYCKAFNVPSKAEVKAW